MGEYVEKPPWLEEWGGGSSIENPHVQRVHYTELLVRALVAGAFTAALLGPLQFDSLPISAGMGFQPLD